MIEQWPVEHPRYVQHGHPTDMGVNGLESAAFDLETGQQVTMKLVERGSQVQQHVKQGAFAKCIATHPHVVKLKEVFLTQRYLGIVTERCNLGTLCRYVTKRRRLTEDQARWFFQQLMIAVDHIHSNMGMAHRDIRTKHIMLSGQETRPLLKLCTFGLASGWHNYNSLDYGALEYASPEVLLGAAMDLQKADVWSCGVVLYFMLTGQYPYHWPRSTLLSSKERHAVRLQHVLSQQVELPSGLMLSQQCRFMLEGMFKRSPQERFSVWNVLQHPWFHINLPKGVLSMNSRVPVDDNSEAMVVRRLVKEAQRMPEAHQADCSSAVLTHSTQDGHYSQHNMYPSQLRSPVTEREQATQCESSDGARKLTQVMPEGSHAPDRLHAPLSLITSISERPQLQRKLPSSPLLVASAQCQSQGRIVAGLHASVQAALLKGRQGLLKASTTVAASHGVGLSSDSNAVNASSDSLAV